MTLQHASSGHDIGKCQQEESDEEERWESERSCLYGLGGATGTRCTVTVRDQG